MATRLTHLRIDPATERDAPIILALIKALAEYERMASDVVADEALVQSSFFGPSPSAEAVIARVADEPVGFAVWFHNHSTFLGRRGLYLEDLFVTPAWRGQGVGRALLAHLAQVAVDRGCGRMEWSVLNWNEPAIRFYRSLGAKPMDEWRVYRLAGDDIARLAAERRAGEDGGR
jgi:GNAT superfamily N-acetyltransferase